MRRARVLAVSSALLFVSVAFTPCHFLSLDQAGVEAVPADASILITEFYPCGLLDDEYVKLKSAMQIPIDLRNWSLTDGEGVLRFCQDQWLQPTASLTISMNSSSYFSAFGAYPDISTNDPRTQRNVSLNGSWRLSDSGDSLALLDSSGTVVDFVVYGNCSDTSRFWNGSPIPALRKGEVAKRIAASMSHRETNSRMDWQPFREYKYGYTEFESLETTVAPGALTAFLSPDCSLEVVTETFSSARSSIRLCSYELDSVAVCTSLLQAVARGVNVRVLLDGAPAGGIGERETICASVLAAGGVHLDMLNGNLDLKIVQHIGPLHAKYAVVDSRVSIVLSENFVESGLPVDKLCGNRGWGVKIDDPNVARYLGELFDSDSRASRGDVLEWKKDARFDANAVLPASHQINHTRGMLLPLRSTCESIVRLVLSPDGSLAAPFAVSILSAASSVKTEQFQVDQLWDTRWDESPRPSPLLEALKVSMSRGSSVEMLLDSTWFNLGMNSKVVADMTSDALNESWAGEFKLLDASGPVTVLHNKGAVIDGGRVLISSNNWVYSSFARNRELAAILESNELATYFSKAFGLDWTPDDTAPIADAGEDQTIGLGEQVLLDAGGSSDDRVIAHWAWDIDEDGEAECTSEQARFFATKPGRIEISLTVEDAWGNKGYDTVAIEIRSDDSPTSYGGDSLGRLGVLVSIAGGSVGLLIGALVAKHQLRSTRKLNHPRRD
jgi:phosphatidylserine/phosphatidylglycerophosphate/cardiolipin synthase-like enzyme